MRARFAGFQRLHAPMPPHPWTAGPSCMPSGSAPSSGSGRVRAAARPVTSAGKPVVGPVRRANSATPASCCPAEAEVEGREVALQELRVEGLPAGRLLGDLGDLLQGEVAGGEEGLGGPSRTIAGLARPGSRLRAAQTAKTNGSPVHSFHICPRSWTCRPSRGRVVQVGAQRRVADQHGGVRLLHHQAEVGRAGVVVGLRPRTARPAAAGPGVRRCARWSRGRPGRRRAGPAAPGRRSRRTSPGRRSRPRCRGRRRARRRCAGTRRG